jgi:glycosyltransferase involved in cell wall biosynthesis
MIAECIGWVVAIVPAREEAATIGEAVQSPLSQDYSGPLDVIVVHEHSTDGAACIASKPLIWPEPLTVCP